MHWSNEQLHLYIHQLYKQLYVYVVYVALVKQTNPSFISFKLKLCVHISQIDKKLHKKRPYVCTFIK